MSNPINKRLVIKRWRLRARGRSAALRPSSNL